MWLIKEKLIISIRNFSNYYQVPTWPVFAETVTIFISYHSTVVYSLIYLYRELFERAIHLKLSSKRMKFFFKRYLTFEEQYGNEATVLAVKEKALSYVKSVT